MLFRLPRACAGAGSGCVRDRSDTLQAPMHLPRVCASLGRVSVEFPSGFVH
ncbi:hypothetical protein GBAR_LOCUS274 [Geodia barretti]|uniref:Uncharacterized protein n=1 Tax=Geodia barretti TaxID=519541 RepID=A0AA35QSA1_GEOBA|nr:hypothetical protein GBAR_LOCUS274 [Geodia barretti]